MPSKTRKRRKSMPWSGWAKISPKGHARTVMKRKCGKKCFLGPKKSFPICAKGTCKVNKKGLYAAYVRARQWGKKRSSYKGRSRPTMRQSTYKRVARKAKSMLKRRGALRGGKKRKSRSRKRKRSRSRRRKSRSRKRKRSRSRRRKSRSRKRKRSRSRRRKSRSRKRKRSRSRRRR